MTTAHQQSLSSARNPSSGAEDGRSRRRERTRAALLDAARRLLAEGSADASIRTITDRAGVGFGSFSNHFPGGKEELWSAAVLELLDQHAAWVVASTADLADPVDVFARAFRMTGRLAVARPDLVRPVLTHGMPLVLAPRRLREAAGDVLARGEAQGSFAPMDPELRLSSLAGSLMGMFQLFVRDPSTASEQAVDAVARSLLRFLGVDDLRAEKAVEAPLPASRPWTTSPDTPK